MPRVLKRKCKKITPKAKSAIKKAKRKPAKKKPVTKKKVKLKAKRNPPTYDPSKPLPDPREEKYANLIVASPQMYRFEMYKEAGWKPGNDNSARACASAKLAEPNMQARITWLQEQRAERTVAGIQERKEILTEIARSRVSDFGTAGPDGFICDVGPENVNSAGLSGIKTRTIVTGEGDGQQEFMVTEIKVRDAVPAVKELNKMEGVYPAKEVDHRIYGALNINLNLGTKKKEPK